MNQNPYAAPSAGPPLPGAPPPGPIVAGAPQPWEVGEVLSLAWSQFKPHWVTLVFSFFLGGVIASVPRLAPQAIVQFGAVDPHDTSFLVVTVVFTLIGLVVQMFFQAGWIKMWVATARGQTPSFNDMFSGGSSFLPLLAMMALSLLATAFGYIFFVVPGVIIGLGFSLAQFYVVDQKMGPIAALKASWAATTGHKGKLFVFAIVMVLMLLGGLFACCIGMYVAMPVTSVAFALIYLRLSGTGPAMNTGGSFGGYGGAYGAPPPMGYGAPPPGGFGGAPPV